MATVKLIFFNWDEFFNNAVKVLTDSDWGHVGIILEETETDYVVGEMLWKGKIISKYSKVWYKELEANKTAKIIDTGYEAKQDIKATFQSIDIKGYDILALLKNIISLISTKVHFIWKRSHYAICSELVAMTLRLCTDLDIASKLNKDEEALSPQDLWQYLTACTTNNG